MKCKLRLRTLLQRRLWAQPKDKKHKNYGQISEVDVGQFPIHAFLRWIEIGDDRVSGPTPGRLARSTILPRSMLS